MSKPFEINVSPTYARTLDELAEKTSKAMSTCTECWGLVSEAHFDDHQAWHAEQNSK